MAALHAALKALGPVEFAEVPTDVKQLDTFISDHFTQSQLIVDSIPIEDASTQAADDLQPFHAKSASEIRPSSTRGDPPSEESLALQKTWGKPIKLSAKDNVLGMSVYKTSGKDGRGAWFARRSIHEGLGFTKFKRGMEREFEQSLAVHGAPGEGNIRGIGGEERVEKIEVPGKGKVEVFRLSAQFPGPTTPRDFVTMLVTSDNALDAGEMDSHGSTPRHYMMISKPCDHLDTQPQDGFIRGSYESVEFIREIPRKLKTSLSSTELRQASGTDTDDIGRDAMIRNAKQRTKTFPGDPSLSNRSSEEDESNPVEWIMVTRSDPGGSVPRFMVERGTPASICADGVKFLDWACQDSTKEDQSENEPIGKAVRPPAGRRDSYQSFRSSRVAGVDDEGPVDPAVVPVDNVGDHSHDAGHPSSSGFLGAVTGAVSAYTPQIVLDHLPGGATAQSAANANPEKEISLVPDNGDDRASIISSTSFQSAEDHLAMSSEDEVSDAHSGSSKTTQSKGKGHNRHQSQHEKELAKLEERRAALQSRFTASRTKLTDQMTEHSAKEEASHRKAMEKHEKDLKKHEEKYQKEMKKLEQRQKKERQKLEEKQRKQADKNEQGRLTRERDEARKEADLFKKETEMLRVVIEDIQRENTALVAKLGKLSNTAVAEVRSEVANTTTTSSSRLSGDGESRSRSTSLKRAGLASRDTFKEKSTSALSSGQGHGHGHVLNDEEASIKSTKS